MTHIAIVGAAGRMGRKLVEIIANHPDATLTAAIEQPGLGVIGADAGEVAGVGNLQVALVNDLKQVTDDFDVLIDFTTANATAQHLEICATNGNSMVIGTTGLSQKQNRRLEEISANIPIVYAPNYSIGINATFKLLEVAAKIFGHDVDIEITEAHHRHKTDAPSGTALKMGKIITNVLGRDFDKVAVYGRQGMTGPRARQTIGFNVLRASDIIGEHQVMFGGQGERVEISHRAHSRTNFAEGAVRAAMWLTSQNVGLFDMQDVLGLKDIGVKSLDQYIKR